MLYKFLSSHVEDTLSRMDGFQLNVELTPFESVSWGVTLLSYIASHSGTHDAYIQKIQISYPEDEKKRIFSL